MLPEYLTTDRDTVERVSRQNCQMVRITNSHVLCRVLGKYIIYADCDDVGITPHLGMDGFWESWITVAMARLLRSGWRCIDVGANHGYYTVIMADAVGAGGLVAAFEPNPRLVETIRLNLEVNGLDGWTIVHSKAASDSRAESVQMVVPQNRAMMATMCRQPTALDEVIRVETVTIDDMTAEWPHVDFIKIDAEGAEEKIWRGMEQTLKRHPNIAIVMEFCAKRYADSLLFLGAIRQAGFPFRHIDFDASVKAVTEEELLTQRIGEDWMLFLQRGDA